jgi:Divergent InlB B-repeat domain
MKQCSNTLIAIALACLLSGVLADSAAAAPWQPAVQLAEPGTYNSDVEVGFDGAGNALAVWRHSAGTEFVQVAEKPAGGSWQPPLNLSSSAFPPASPQLAVDPAGDAVVVWSALDGSEQAVWAAVRSAGGAWQAPVVISEPGLNAERARVAIDPAGAAVVVWEGWSGRPFEGGQAVVQAAAMTAAGAWESPLTLSPSSQEELSPDVAFDSEGGTTVVWQRYDGSAGIIEADERDSGGRWQSRVPISEPGINAIEAQVAGDAEGGMVAIWARWDGSEWIIQGSNRAAGGSWAPPADISTPGRTALSPRLAVDAGGGAIAVWQTHVAQFIWMVQAASGLGNVWEAPVDVSTAAEIGEPDVAVDPAGDAVVSWIINNQYPQVATKTANGVWQPPIYVPQYTGSHAKVAVDSNGNAIVASQHPSFSGPESGVQATEHEAIRLAVARTGSGSGTVESAPDGIDCGPVCSAQFEDESTATLSAEAAAGSEFSGWSGACSGTGPCTVDLSASRSVSANFKLLAQTPTHDQEPVTGPASGSGSAPRSAPAPAPATCSAVAASAGTFAPIPGPGRAIPGVRVKVGVGTPSQLQVEPTLTYQSGGQTQHVDLATVALHTSALRNLRIALPAELRGALPLGKRVALSLRISVTPDTSPDCAPAISTRQVKVRVMRVLAAPQPGVS